MMGRPFGNHPLSLFISTRQSFKSHCPEKEENHPCLRDVLTPARPVSHIETRGP